MIVGLWLTPFLLRNIGQHDYGLWLVGTQLLTYLTLTDFGVVALLPIETAQATGRAGGVEKAEDLSELVGQTVRLVLWQLPVVIMVALAMWFTIPPEWSSLRGPLAIVLTGFVISFPLRIPAALMHGLQDFSFVNSMMTINWIVSTVLTVVMVLEGWSIYALAIGWVISQTIFTPVYLYRLRLRFPQVIPRKIPHLTWASSKGRLEKGFWISVAQVAELLMGNTDLLIIARFLGPEAVVPYVCTGKLVGVLANQANLLMQTATPGLCELKAGESKARILQALTAMSHGMLALGGLIFCVVMVVNQWFVSWWVTAGRYGGFTLTVVILVNVIIGQMKSVSAYTVFAFGHQRRISLTNLLNGVVNVVASLGFVAVMGPVGAPAGILVGTCFVSLPLNLGVIARDAGVSVWSLFRQIVEGWWWRFGLVASICFLLAERWSPRNIFEGAGTALVVTVAYSGVMIPVVLRSPLGGYIRHLRASLSTSFTPVARAST